MSDDQQPTLYELFRLIQRNHEETRHDIQAIHQRLDRELAHTNGRVDQAVPLNVYEADKRGTDLRFKNVEEAVASMKGTTKWAIGLAVTSALGIGAIVVTVAVPLLAG